MTPCPSRSSRWTPTAPSARPWTPSRATPAPAFLAKAGFLGGGLLGGGALLDLMEDEARPRAWRQRRQHPQLRPHARVPRGGLLHRGRRKGRAHGELALFARVGGRARARARRGAQAGAGAAGRSGARASTSAARRRAVEVPRHRDRARGHRRVGLRRPGSARQGRRGPRGRAGHPQRGGPPRRLDPRHRRRGPAPRAFDRPKSKARRAARGPQYALHPRLSPGRCRSTAVLSRRARYARAMAQEDAAFRGLRAGRAAHDVRGDGRPPGHRHPPRHPRPRHAAALRARARRPARHLALHAAPGDHDARAERAPALRARPRRRHVRRARAAAGRGRASALRPDWREVLDLRLAVETGAATLAAARADAGDARSRCASASRGCATAADFETYRRADIRFHIALAQATGVARLVGLASRGAGRDLRARRAHRPPAARCSSHSNGEHARIADALAQPATSRRAVALVRRHLEGTEHILAGLMP